MKSLFVVALMFLLPQSADVLPCVSRLCGQFSSDDRRQIARVAATDGMPWLSVARAGVVRGFGLVFLRADTSAPQLRRGRYVEVSFYTNRGAIREPHVWSRVAGVSGRYAQVVLPDRAADD